MKGDDNGNYYESTDGLRLFYRDYAPEHPGATVLCLPGLTRNSRDFDDLAAHLSATRRVLTPDLRGRGHSAHDPDWRNYHPATYTGDIWKLLDSLDVDNVIIIGTSLGGIIAMGMAMQKPTRIRGVVMNDVGPEIAPEGLQRIQKYTGLLPPVGSWEEAIAQTREIYGTWLPGLTEDGWRKMAWRAYRENNDGVPQLDIDPNIGRAIREAGAPGGDLWAAFDALQDIPTLVLRGELSDILSADTLTRMQERKPDLVAVTVSNRGHVPLLNEPECIAAIDRFLGGL
ncbi:MAG TPA: alpha/beta hydrolase [Woeseiaceae bacterium]